MAFNWKVRIELKKRFQEGNNGFCQLGGKHERVIKELPVSAALFFFLRVFFSRGVRGVPLLQIRLVVWLRKCMLKPEPAAGVVCIFAYPVTVIFLFYRGVYRGEALL